MPCKRSSVVRRIDVGFEKNLNIIFPNEHMSLAKKTRKLNQLVLERLIRR